MSRFHRHRAQFNGAEEDAVTFFSESGMPILQIIDCPAVAPELIATTMMVAGPGGVTVKVELNVDQVAELGRFCVEQFCRMGATLRDVEANAKYVRLALEAWDERAKADEEHPPYDTLVGRLREIQKSLDSLEFIRRDS